MKYPFQPDILDALPEELAELFRTLELTLLKEICSRLKAAGQLNEVTVQDIRALRSHGIDLKDIERAIQKTTGISRKKLNALLADVVERNQQYYSEVLDLANLTAPDMLVSNADIAAITTHAQREFGNLTRSMGFLVDNGRTMLPPARAYQWALDNAVMQMQSGAINYNQAIASAVKQLADSGIKTVSYESGHIDSIDVAARRAVMTGVSQLCDKYTEQSAEYLGTRYYEISAHSGARDKPGPSPWSSHKDWQGKVYYASDHGEPDPLGKYPDLVDKTGFGYVDGLEGANCRHRRWAWLEGVMERTYTDEQLEHIDDGLGCEFEGKHYTAYEATQMQRSIERSIRKQERLKAAYEAAGLKDKAQEVNIRIRRLKKKYKDFSKAAGLPEQWERAKAYTPTAKKQFQNPPTRGIMEEKSGEGGSVQTIGKIDIEKYRGVSDKIRTDEVVLTDKQRKHIIDRRGKEFYEKYHSFFRSVAEQPDYIFSDKAHPNTAIASKALLVDGKNLNLVIRLAVEGDEVGLKNSIITVIVENNKRYQQRLRNNIPLYKRE